MFFATHDPTTLNRQGNDVGTQYRSAIFYANNEQKREAEDFINELDAAGTFATRMVTTLEPLSDFYEAERDHQKYYANNPYQPYCQVMIPPKLNKLHKAVYRIAEVARQRRELGVEREEICCSPISIELRRRTFSRY